MTRKPAENLQVAFGTRNLHGDKDRLRRNLGAAALKIGVAGVIAEIGRLQHGGDRAIATQQLNRVVGELRAAGRTVPA